MQKVKSLGGFLDRSLEIIAVICLIFSVGLNIIGVFLRYVLDMSYPIIDELCRYSIIYGVFLFIGPLILKNEHLNMNVLQERLNGKAKYINELLLSVILCASFIFLCWSSTIWAFSLLSMHVRTMSGLMLMFIPALALPIGMLLGSLYSIVKVILDIHQLRELKKPEKTSRVDTIQAEIGSENI